MTKYTKGFRKTSSDDGEELFSLSSTEVEAVKCEKVVITDVTGGAVDFELFIEKEALIKDVPLEEIADLAPPRELEVDFEIPVGEKITAYITTHSSGHDGTVVGWVVYSPIS